MRILICDDDALIVEQLQKYIRNFFEKIGVKCPELVCFSDGESLLADKGEKDSKEAAQSEDEGQDQGDQSTDSLLQDFENQQADGTAYDQFFGFLN